MKQIVVALALLSVAACGKKSDDKAPAADKMAGDKVGPGTTGPAGADNADVDCEKMTTHNVAVLMKDATAGKTDDEKKQMTDAITAQHATMVKACEDEKGTKKLTHKQYDCILASQSTAELTACVTPK